ncbi:putative bifunctional diguanylate cyclase/phosphodiesterase [Motilibacter aurantiacus]|uniref:putative bifunctional diguanylate cyclase/phosphodiesterase n=1 Tax=Motilibacter aurantiacus TaxID=2714955 RepID=UPI0014097966|nr:bifunctional diguanylate cyclase/phosphodiesterase [Motilibacter aurantiacus]NHC46651.1 bifunctional diguanylate cyclase/phosphodiesterase [Motilibacter aurantiacus]
MAKHPGGGADQGVMSGVASAPALRGVRGQLAVLAALAALALAVPPLRPPLLLLSNWAAVVLVLAGPRRSPGAPLRVVVPLALFATCVAVGNTALTVAGEENTLSRLATGLAQPAAALILPALFRSSAAPRRGLLLDGLVLGVPVALVAAELALRGAQEHRTSGLHWELAVAPAADVVLLGLLAWLALTRSRLVPAIALGLAGGVGCTVYDLIVTLGGQRVALPGQAVQALGVVDMLLFGLAAVHPSAQALGTRSGAASPRRPHVQVLLLLPLAATPALLLVSHGVGLPLLVPEWALGGAALVAVLAVATRAVQALREVERRSTRDPLTGYLNRAGVVDALGRVTAQGRGAELVLLNLRRFSELNEALGHEAGDELLRTVADRVAGQLCPDDRLGRTDGDEFALVLPDAPPDVVAKRAERLITAFAAPFEVQGMALHVTARTGLVDAAPGDDPEDLLRRAGVAVHAAEQSGGLPVRHEDRLDDAARRRFQLAEDLRDGLARFELELHYQPKVDLYTGGLFGVEALVRWRHPQRGLVPPDDFIPLAETTGLIVPLTEQVLDEAVRQARLWLAQGHRVPVAVNVSPACLLADGFVDGVGERLARHGLPAGLLRLEITETALLRDAERAIAELHALAALGVKLSLDDFGTGYSSMSYLRRLPADELKIDRSFVTGLAGTGGRDDILVAAMVQLGHSLGLFVVAEGVEDAETADALAELGCDVGQGYWWSRPVPASQLADWLTRSPAAQGLSERARPSSA